MGKYLSLFCFFFWSIGSIAQEMEISAIQGALIAHRPPMDALYSDHQSGMLVRYSHRVNPGVIQERNTSHFDFHYFQFTLGNDAILGNSKGILLGYRKEGNKRALSFYWCGGAGLGFVSKVFDRESNRKNVALGSHYNAAIYLGAGSALRILPKWKISVGATVVHLSNAAFKVPNLGVNYLGYKMGISHVFSTQTFRGLSLNKTGNHSGRWELAYNLGNKQTPPYGSEFYLTHSLYLNRVWTKQQGAWIVGLSGFFNRSLLQEAESRNRTIDPGDLLRLGFQIGGEQWLGRFRIGGNAGLYLRDPALFQGRFFHRIYWAYEAGRQWGFQLGLKTHFAKADHMEFGIVKRWGN